MMISEVHNIKNYYKIILILFITVLGVFAALFGIIMFNKYLLMIFSLGIRMVLMLVTQWAVLIIPLVMMGLTKTKLLDLGFVKENIFKQILIGIILAFAMSFLFTVVPILVGFESSIAGNQYKYMWQFIYDFIHKIIAVALVEEVIFRGYIYKTLLEIKNSDCFAISISSLLFGLFHIFNGNFIQVIMMTFIGIIFCICRKKVKGCTLLSLIFMHGVYDWLIQIWGYIL